MESNIDHFGWVSYEENYLDCYLFFEEVLEYVFDMQLDSQSLVPSLHVETGLIKDGNANSSLLNFTSFGAKLLD